MPPGKDRAGNPIRIQLPVVSISLKRFLEKTIADDGFFDFALENPIGALVETGVHVDPSEFSPEDFASLFDVIGRLKEAIKAKSLKDLSFEGVFGYDPDIPDICAEFRAFRGFYREWDNRQAILKQSRFMSFNQEFSRMRPLDVEVRRGILATSRLEATMLGVGATSQSKEAFQAYDKEWDNADAKYEKRATTNRDKGFGKDGLTLLEDVLRGPLIHPVDLARLVGKLDAVIETGQFGRS